MSRSGYSDDEGEPGQFAMWRGQVASAFRGRRGQRLLHDLVAALDAMPDKRLISQHIATPDGAVCALGALGKHRGVDLSRFEQRIESDGYCNDPEYLSSGMAKEFDVAHQMISEIQYYNDEVFDFHYVDNKRVEYTPEERWQKMRDWVAKNLKPVEP